jgi:hypothetical protein
MKARLLAIEITGEGNHLDTRMTWLAIGKPQSMGKSTAISAEVAALLDPFRPKPAQADPWETKTTYKPKA